MAYFVEWLAFWTWEYRLFINFWSSSRAYWIIWCSKSQFWIKSLSSCIPHCFRWVSCDQTDLNGLERILILGSAVTDAISIDTWLKKKRERERKVMSMTCLLFIGKSHIISEKVSLNIWRLKDRKMTHCVSKPKSDFISNIAPPGHEDFNSVSVSIWLQMHLKEPCYINNNVSVDKFDSGRGSLHLIV